MAKKKSDSNVTRISASDSGKSAKATKAAPAKTTKKSQTSKTLKSTKPRGATAKAIKEARETKLPKPVRTVLRPFASLGAYFKGAWYELNQVRWPTRRATLSLTVAVLIFTGFFVLFIGILDAAFKYIFEQLLA